MTVIDQFAGDEHDSAGYSATSLISVCCGLRGCTVWEHGILTFGNTGENGLWRECCNAQPWSPGLHAAGVKRMKETPGKKQVFITDLVIFSFHF